MARPLPKDLEDQIAKVAKKAEIRSVAFFAFVTGIAFGFGLGGLVDTSTNDISFFAIGAGVIGLIWFLATRSKDNK